MQVAPYYNKPTQEGLFQHFRAIACATRLPVVLYSIPGRCGVEISVETVQRLARQCRNVVGIKEAGGNADRVSQLRAALGPKFTILSGDDSLTLPIMSVGGRGVISVVANIAPAAVAQAPAVLLPEDFSGWQKAEVVRRGAQPSQGGLGGEVGVESDGSGTRFRVRLPGA